MSCPERPDRYYESLRVGLGDLDDHFETTSLAVEDFGLRGRVLADGGPGDDELFGGASDNELEGGDGNDLLIAGAGGSGHRLDGGPGDDRLLGGPSFDELNGGGGRDEIFGGGGDDRITDGDSDEATGDAAPGPDLLDGGDDGCCSIWGGDLVSYSGRSAPVVVDLAARGPTDGEAGEADTIVGIESVEGGSGADRLLGNRLANTLIGDAGLDRLKGRAGSDELYLGSFVPTTLKPPAIADRVSCGSGRESVWFPDHTTFIPRGCEFVTWPDNRYRPYPKRLAGGRLRYTVACPYFETDGLPVPPCRGHVRLAQASDPHRTLAATAMPLRRWRGEPLVIPLTARGRNIAAAGRKVRAIVHFDYYAPATRHFPSWSRDYSWMIKLKPPR